jgi:hypothetical protein
MALKKKTFVFDSPLTEWTVSHNFGKFVTSDVFIENGNGSFSKILPLNVEHIDANTLKITFTDPQKGFIRVI